MHPRAERRPSARWQQDAHGESANYVLLREIGRGGMGVVYEAIHTPTGERRAIKFLPPSAAGSADQIERMAREARTAGMLRSEHATHVTSFGLTPDRMPYIVMELLRGQDLASRLAEAPRGLPVDLAIEIVRQACDAVGEAHEHGIVHRDLKPGNIFLTRREAGGVHVKLLDFGLAKLSSGHVETRTSSGLVFGTPQFMSPEQLKSSTDVDARADVWALGVILYQLVYGVLPFDGQNVSQVIAGILSNQPAMPAAAASGCVPSELRAVIARCLAKKARGRYRNARELAVDLQGIARARRRQSEAADLTPRPWSMDHILAEAPSAGTAIGASSAGAEWSRLEWCGAVGCCVLMLLLGVLTSSIGRPRAATAASEAPPEAAVELTLVAPSAPAAPFAPAADPVPPVVIAPPDVAVVAAPSATAPVRRAPHRLVPRRVERQPDP